jgi:transmembrane sensor
MTITQTQSIEAIAAAFIARQDSSESTEADELEREAWLSSDHRHRTAYLRLWAAWQAADILTSVPAVDAEPVTVSVPKRRWMIRYAIGSGVTVALAAYFLVGTPTKQHSLPLKPSQYSTVLGAQLDQTLPDGSQVELNSATKVEIRFSQRSRQLDLVSGEAYFDVKHDAKIPFVVYAGSYRVTAVGTAFSVRRDQDQLIVVVNQGTVRIDKIDGTDARLVNAGMLAQVGTNGVVIAPSGIDKVEQALAWREGLLSFDQTTLADISAEFNRYNGQKLYVTGRLQSRRMGGIFKATDMAAFVSVLVRADPRIEATTGADGSIYLREK